MLQPQNFKFAGYKSQIFLTKWDRMKTPYHPMIHLFEKYFKYLCYFYKFHILFCANTLYLYKLHLNYWNRDWLIRELIRDLDVFYVKMNSRLSTKDQKSKSEKKTIIHNVNAGYSKIKWKQKSKEKKKTLKSEKQ